MTDSCLWFDEIFSIHAAEHPWGEIIPFIAKDLIHPPLSYLLLKIWIGGGGSESLIWLRLFPVLISVLALIPLWFLCRELKLPEGTTVVAFGLFAINGALIKYAQEVRMYSLLLFLGTVSIWLFSRYYFRGKSFWMLVIANVLLVYTHYFGWFVVGAEVLLIAISQRIKILRTLLMAAVVVTAFVPWIYSLIRFAEPGSTVRQNIGWMSRPGLREILGLIFDLVDPFYFQQTSADAAAFYPVAFTLLLLIATAATIYLASFRESEHKERLLFLFILAAFPLLSVFALSWVLPVSIWGSRHLLIVFVPVILLFVIYLTELKSRLLQHIFLAAVALLSAAAFIVQFRTPPQNFSWCNWQSAYTEFTNQRIAPDEKLYAFEDLAAYHLWFAARHSQPANIVLIKNTGAPEDPAYFLPRGFHAIQTTDEFTTLPDKTVWLTFRSKTLDQTKPPLMSLVTNGYQVTKTIDLPAADSTVFFVQLERN